MAKLTEYPQALTFDANDILIKDGTNGTKKITVEDAAKYFSQYTNTNIASAFSTQTAYTKGAYVLKDGVLYRFTENHAAGAWSTSDTTEIKLASDMSALAALLDETNAAVVSVEGDVASILGIIASYVSATMTAPSNITSGEYVLANGVLYRATANIASGSTLTPNGNVVAVTIGEELFEVIKSNAKKADANGTYDEMTVGQSKQLLSDDTVKDQTPYIMRTSGGALEISDREKNTIVGGTIAWNQQIKNGNFVGTTDWGQTGGALSAADNVLTYTAGTQIGLYSILKQVSPIPSLAGHRLLFSLDVYCEKATSIRIGGPGAGFGDYGLTATEIVAGQWTKISKVGSVANGNTITVLAIYLNTNGVLVQNDTVQFKNITVFDLTQMFGTTIADYIYSLEQETAGAGVAWFKKLFPKEYYAYYTGPLQSVKTSAHKMVGFNAFDKNASDITNGKYLDNNGVPQTNSARKITGYIPVIGGQRYYFADAAASSIAAYYVWYNSEKNIISGGTIPYTGGSAASHLKTAPANAAYLRVSVINEKWDSFIVNLSLDDEKDGTYEPYVEYNYPLDSSLELRGIPELDGNNRLRFNGDTYESNGTVTRKYTYARFVGADGEGWTDTSGSGNPRKTFRTTSLIANTAYTNMLTNGITVSTSSGSTESDEITCRGTAYSSTIFYIFAPESKIANLTAFKAWLATNPIEIVYPIDTPTTETAEPYAEFQTVSNLGTEEYIDAGVAAGTRDVEIPVGNITEYYQNLRAKLESAPDSPDDDGDYILRRSSGENAYTRAEPIFAGKANTEGNYPNLTAGGAQQLMSTVGIEDQVPYNFRTSGGTADIGDREEDMIVGGTIAWNQQIRNGNFADTSGWSVPTSATFTVENGKATISNTTSSYTRIQRTSNSKAYANHKYLIMLKVSSSAGKVTLIPMGSTSGGMFSFTGLTEETQIAKIWAPEEDYTTVSWHVRFNVTTPDVSEQITATVRDYCAFDLTQMFGTTIADYIYSLEQANAGDGVAWFKKLFPKEYYAYYTGPLQSVQTSAHKMVGFNAWDEEWESGTIQSANGQNAPDTNRIRSKNYIPVVPNQPYYLKAPQYAIIYQYDSDKNFLGTTGSRGDNRISVFNSPTAYVRFAVGSSSNPVTTYDNDICLNLSWDGEKDGTYESYVEYNYPLDSSLELRGIPELDGNNRLRFNGDTYESDGTVTRKYAYARFVGADDEGWTDRTGSGNLRKTFRTTSLVANTAYTNMLSNGITVSSSSEMVDTAEITCRGTNYSSTYFYIFAPEDKIADLTALKAWLAANPVEIVYPVDTPTTETAEPYTNPQIVNDFGTEEYVDAGVEAGTRDVAIPVGHETFYQANLRAKLEMSPDSPDGDGDYIVRQVNGENTYVPLVIPNELPAAPSTDGTYVLHATVADGVLTYSWVANT